MGQAGSRLTRPIRNFNIENRAAKVIEKRKVVADPAPKYESSQIQMSKFREEHPDLVDVVEKKNEDLHERLKHVYVNSNDVTPEFEAVTRPNPQSRDIKPDTELGAMDVNYEVPKGKADLKTMLQFIGQNQMEPHKHTAASIAQAHNLNQIDVENILKHFFSLQVYLPSEMLKDKKMNKVLQEQVSSGSPLSPFQPQLPGQTSDKNTSTGTSLGDGLPKNRNS